MLHLRILSALVGIPLILGLVYLGGGYYLCFILLLAYLGMREYTALLKSKGYHLPSFLGYAGATVLPALLYLEPILERELIFPAIIFILMSLAIFFLIFFETSDIRESALIFWGIIYFGGLGGCLVLLRQLPQGLSYTFALFIGVWTNDTLAYFAGTKWGKHRLAPAISPRKSVEGACSGIAGTILLALLIVFFFPGWINLTPGQAVFLGLVITVFAQLGDLFESAIKRQFEVKDTGQLIPGHGGIMDRFDSLLFSAPAVYCFFQLLS